MFEGSFSHVLVPIIIDNTAGGVCDEEDQWQPCSEEKNAMCIDGCCICNSGFTLIRGSCVAGTMYCALSISDYFHTIRNK